ncbi:MAG: hypothetical protein LBT17_00760, partial [Mycoplasmataceae bacterium]|nr:hypothetical protein [Mycoplasmataceae bacterium]
MLKEYLKKYLLLVVALVISFLIVLLFLIWFLKDILEFQDIYIPWILIVFTGVFITCIILTIVIS